MIIVRVELLSARTGKRSLLGEMHLVNDGTGDERRGNYTAWLFRKGTRQLHRKAPVKDYPRLAYPVWVLVKRALEELYP